MGMNIKDPQVHAMARQLAARRGTTVTDAVRQAALQWAPAYCLRKDRFNFALSQMPDNAGWENMENDSGPAAFVSSLSLRPPQVVGRPANPHLAGLNPTPV